VGFVLLLFFLWVSLFVLFCAGRRTGGEEGRGFLWVVLFSGRMAKASWLVMGFISLFQFIAFGLALGAIARRSKATLTQLGDSMEQCTYTADISTGLAIAAFIFLLIGQVFTMFVTRCLCCGGTFKSGAARVFAVILFILSWLGFLIAEAYLLAGASNNATHTKGQYDAGGPDVTCKQVRQAIFSVGAAFSFLTMLLNLLYYFTFTKASSDSEVPWQFRSGGGPAVGMASFK